MHKWVLWDGQNKLIVSYMSPDNQFGSMFAACSELIWNVLLRTQYDDVWIIRVSMSPHTCSHAVRGQQIYHCTYYLLSRMIPFELANPNLSLMLRLLVYFKPRITAWHFSSFKTLSRAGHYLRHNHCFGRPLLHLPETSSFSAIWLRSCLRKWPNHFSLLFSRKVLWVWFVPVSWEIVAVQTFQHQ